MSTGEPQVPVMPLNATSNLRMALLLCVPAGGLAALVLALVGHPLAGAYVALGLALGLVNAVLVRRSVAKCVQTNRRPNFVGGAIGRLGILSLVAFGIALLARPDGLGALLGLVLFQLLSIGSAALPAVREIRRA